MTSFEHVRRLVRRVLAAGSTIGTANGLMCGPPPHYSVAVPLEVPVHPSSSVERETLPMETCAKLCPSRTYQHSVLQSCAYALICDRDGGGCPADELSTTNAAICSYSYFPPAGRRPNGFAPQPDHGARDEAGRLLARMAVLEAASIDAFSDLAAHLARLGAPRGLLARARRSRRDEVEHTRLATALARQRGVDPRLPNRRRPKPTRRPNLLELALDNAREGCVRELFGAVVAAHQARVAQDTGTRGALRRIARDEAAHAALALDVDTWLRRRLSAEDNARIDEAVCVAWEEVRRDAARGWGSRAASIRIGLPSRELALTWLDLLGSRTIASTCRPHRARSA